jgi:hypothetical protein
MAEKKKRSRNKIFGASVDGECGNMAIGQAKSPDTVWCPVWCH